LRPFIKSLVLLLPLFFCAPAFADLSDANVTVNYLYPDMGTIFQVLGTGTVTDSGFKVDFENEEQFAVYPNTLQLFNLTGGYISVDPADFNGFQLAVNAGGSPITGITIEFSNISGFDLSRVTFNSDDVWINLEGLTLNPGGLDLQLGLDFSSSTTPEPTSILLFTSGIAAAWGVCRRRNLYR
jgi:hypothetical protein